MDNLLDDLNTPEQDNFNKQEELELVQVNDLSAHAKKYEWIKSRYGAIHPYTAKQAEEKLLKINKKDFLKSYNQEKKKVRNAITRAKKILGKDSHIVDLMQFVVHYRTQRTDITNRSQYIFIPGLKKLAKEKALSYEQILYCTKDEILGKLPSKKELNSRIKDSAVIHEYGNIRCVSGKQVHKIREFLKENIQYVNKIKGITACKGKAHGIVKLIYGFDDFDKIKEGDILITSMTSTYMVPIMKKSAAFVTDEGGITCHAAVLSREMKKPCIIGTRIATQVLKDGDKVEVDADKGIVKKIK